MNSYTSACFCSNCINGIPMPPIDGETRARLDAGDEDVRAGRVSKVPAEYLIDEDVCNQGEN